MPSGEGVYTIVSSFSEGVRSVNPRVFSVQKSYIIIDGPDPTLVLNYSANLNIQG